MLKPYNAIVLFERVVYLTIKGAKAASKGIAKATRKLERKLLKVFKDELDKQIIARSELLDNLALERQRIREAQTKLVVGRYQYIERIRKAEADNADI